MGRARRKKRWVSVGKDLDRFVLSGGIIDTIF